ncbi:type II membrane protein [Microbotryomycetes sp. JL201]|nr:type II membrane protein [Microbotryomycetes sp. JL201]
MSPPPRIRTLVQGIGLLASLSTYADAASSYDCKQLLELGSARFDLGPLAGVHKWEVSSNTPPTVTKTWTTRHGYEDRIITVVPISKLGTGDSDRPRAEYLADSKDVEKGWVLKLPGGEYNDVKQLAEIEMTCDEKATETVPTSPEYDVKKGVLSLKWTTASACSTASGNHPALPPPKDDGSGSEKRESAGMGFFGWFFTLLFLGFVAYLVIGSYHNYSQYGATGFDAIPHKDMWRDLPYIIADMFKGRGGSRSGYSALG